MSANPCLVVWSISGKPQKSRVSDQASLKRAISTARLMHTDLASPLSTTKWIASAWQHSNIIQVYLRESSMYSPQFHVAWLHRMWKKILEFLKAGGKLHLLPLKVLGPKLKDSVPFSNHMTIKISWFIPAGHQSYEEPCKQSCICSKNHSRGNQLRSSFFPLFQTTHLYVQWWLCTHTWTKSEV